MKNFLRYTSLNVIAMIGLSCYILADTFFVANGIDMNGLAALNLAIPVYSFINGTGLMFGIGGATKYTICMAREKKEEANQFFTSTLLVGLVVGILFFLVGILFSPSLSRMLGSDSDTFELTNSYLRVILYCSPLFITNNILIAFVRNDGYPQNAMVGMLLGSLVNIVLDYIFIFWFHMGMMGAALATGCAPLVSIIYLTVVVFRPKKNQFVFTRVKNYIANIRTTITLGTSSFITEVSAGVIIIVFNMVILNMEGNRGVAAYGIIANISLVATAVFTGIAQGIQPIISESYGKKDIKKLKQYIHLAFISSLVVSVVLYVVILLFAKDIAMIFNKDKDLLLNQMAVLGLLIYFTGFFFAGINIISSSLCSSIEKPIRSFLLSITRGFVLIIPILWLFSSFFGMRGVWMVFPVCELLTLSLSIYYYRGYFL